VEGEKIMCEEIGHERIIVLPNTHNNPLQRTRQSITIFFMVEMMGQSEGEIFDIPMQCRVL